MGMSSGTEAGGRAGVPRGRGTGMANMEMWEGTEAGIEGWMSTRVESR